ncbi:bifunctional protein-serine/threonine kinase/phosphatase [Undibacterium sp. TS12]|uniref:bifunctional protein-serine/threonine kinase/phosphatase n=1 Tax=Undibacterium sp. TS12 TaxID=2908202 RepID=UPI001F4CF1D5|nr:bifunctional protein-serine/threonine kinase/phosphatase [Undibacterium sp. TS12]MCH8619203.1 bifunctional protein-serine/threonine kinase/phosphatase [Undibacterium sp. TS12]
MPLIVNTGHHSVTGIRPRNEDFVGMVTPGEPELSCKGMVLAVADGVSGNEGGREAAEYVVRGLLTDYYATPDTWEVTTALDKVLVAMNSWVQQQGSVRRELAGMATTLTGLVLRGRMYYSAHVGDSRCYLYRNGSLQKLTQDHVWDRPEMQHVLTRAVGLDSHLVIDHGMGELRSNDVFLLASDGIWATITEYELTDYLKQVSNGSLDSETACQSLCAAALQAGSQDNCSAVIARVDSLPEGELRDAITTLHGLPVPPRLKAGQTIDAYVVEEVMHTSQSTILYRVTDPVHHRQLVLKTLHPDKGDDAQERSAFAHEAWLAKRVVARFFPQVITPDQHNYLYYLSTWHAGASLQKRLEAGQHFTIPEAVAHGGKLVRAVGALHRRSILHRDIKPDNVHLGDDDEIRILDLGVAQSGFDSKDSQAVNHSMAGTPSFLAPEQFTGAAPSRATDIYATGVTLYYLLTRHYPYGEVEPFQRPRFAEPVPPSRYRPDLPHWLENVLLKAVAREQEDRFETAEEFLLALERGAAHPLPTPQAKPLAARDPLATWRMLAVASIVINLLLVYILFAR